MKRSSSQFGILNWTSKISLNILSEGPCVQHFNVWILLNFTKIPSRPVSKCLNERPLIRTSWLLGTSLHHNQRVTNALAHTREYWKATETQIATGCKPRYSEKHFWTQGTSELEAPRTQQPSGSYWRLLGLARCNFWNDQWKHMPS